MKVINVMANVAVGLIFSTLVGCAHYIENPYNGMTKNQLKNINSVDLCSVSGDIRYKININVNNEVARRGFKDCSSSEVYCLSTLSLKPGTNAFAACRLARDQYELNVRSQQMATYLSLQELQVQRDAVAAMNAPKMVLHSGSINVNHSGNINHYIY